jgi:ankyrin repeat protein
MFFLRSGPLENAAEELLQAAREGDLDTVNDLLNRGLVDADVADNTGHAPLIAAAVSVTRY